MWGITILDADTTLTPDYAEKVIQGFTKNVVGVSGRVLSASNKTACQKSRVVEYLFGQKLLKSMQAAIGGMWVLAGCATMWQTRWLKESGGIPDNTLVEDLELTWRAQQDHAVNYVHNAICYTEDPKSFKEYISQLYRWLSWRPALGFVDFMKLKTGLKLVIAWQLFDIVMASLFTIMMIHLITTGKYEYVLISVVIDYLVYVIISGYEGYKVGKFWDALECIPNCMILRYVNIVVLLAALIRPKKKWY
jgi:cellulose synthase/poly-beta-1,6-N-acetylglucosamine synthase-like glycosyltransferase